MKKPKYLLTLNFEEYYNPHRLNSYQDCWLYLLIGGRGIGKTTGLSSVLLDSFFKRNEEFVYVRRYKEEIKKAKSSERGRFGSLLMNQRKKEKRLLANEETRLINLYQHQLPLIE